MGSFMSTMYWSQWDRDDIDSWMGKPLRDDEDDWEYEESTESTEEDEFYQED